MPFTASHVAAILPLARTPLAPAALAIGSMAPDLPYFVPVGIHRSSSHSLTGAVTIDLVICVVAFAAWMLVLRAPVIDALPRALRIRIAPRPRWRAGVGLRGAVITAGLLLAAFLIGIATHLAWDSFTHAGWVASIFPVLQTRIVYPVYDLLHVASSIVGIVLLLIWARHWVARTPPGPDPAMISRAQRLWVWIAPLTVAGILVVVTWLPVQFGQRIPGVPVFNDLDAVAAASISVAGSLVIAFCIVWWVARAVRGRPVAV